MVVQVKLSVQCFWPVDANDPTENCKKMSKWVRFTAALGRDNRTKVNPVCERLDRLVLIV